MLSSRLSNALEENETTVVQNSKLCIICYVVFSVLLVVVL